MGKLRTSPFPGNPRSEWVRTFLIEPHFVDGLLEFSYSVHGDQAAKMRGDNPFLYQSHKAMIREEHQRIIIGPSGGLVHVSGVEVFPEDVADFLASDPAAYIWETKTVTLWTATDGRMLSPFLFPTYWGLSEDLDPQWQREKYILKQQAQINEILDRTYRSVEARRLSGDRRGTILNLIVSAGNDDAQETDSDTSVQRALSTLSCTSTIGLRGFRYQGVSGLSGVTIDAATFSVYHFTTSVDSPDFIIAAEESATPPEFVETNGNISGRTTTTATVTWTASDLGANAYHSAPDIKTVIQELADTYDSSEIVLTNLDNGSSACAIRSYDFNSAQASKLDLDTDAVAVNLSGNQPSASGVLTAQQTLLQALTGAQPAPSGAIALQNLIGLAGAQPAPSGLLTSLWNVVNLAGAQPAPSGSLTAQQTLLRALTGAQPAPSGVLTQVYLVTLAGAQPAPSGVLTGVNLILVALTGGQPAPIGALAQQYQIALTGNQPNTTGALTLTLTFHIALAGDQPAGTGILSPVQALLRSLTGSQPNAIGAISVQYQIALTGAQPAPSGLLTSVQVLLIALTGSQPAPSGTIATSAVTLLVYFGTLDFVATASGAVLGVSATGSGTLDTSK